MNLTRREALARGGGLLAALGLGRLLPSRTNPDPPQAPVEEIVPPEKVREIIHQLMEHNPMLEDMPFVPLEHGPHEKEFLELYEKAQRGVRAAFNPGPKAIRRCRRAARLGLFTAKPRQWFKLS